MSDLSRREFCKKAAALLIAASAAPLLPGCGRLLEWSANRQHGQAGQGTVPASSTSTGSTTSTTASSTTGTTGSTSTTAGRPDLAVFEGDSPGANVRAAVAALGGMAAFVSQGQRVVVKPNVLRGMAPEYAVTTNPEAMAEVIRMCFEAGAAEVTVLDRPTTDARSAFQLSGLEKAAADAGAKVKYLTDRNFESVPIPLGMALQSWPLVSDVLQADVFINMPIAKTHSLAGLTLSMKNLMGIMGGSRGSIHYNFPQKICDINTVVKPTLIVMDAHRILVRNGPTGGNLNDVKLVRKVVAGTNAASVDAYGAGLFGLKPSDLEFLVAAQQRGIGETDVGKLRIVEGRA